MTRSVTALAAICVLGLGSGCGGQAQAGFGFDCTGGYATTGHRCVLTQRATAADVAGQVERMAVPPSGSVHPERAHCVLYAGRTRAVCRAYLPVVGGAATGGSWARLWFRIDSSNLVASPDCRQPGGNRLCDSS